jgi:cysteine desulfurase/selenocysteine lyase
MFDPEDIKKDFPILKRQVHGKRLIYLDNAATSQKPIQMIDAITEYYKKYNSNIHRGVHTLSAEATQEYETAREKVARFINAPNVKSIIFVRNTTEAINLIAYSWGLKNLKEGDEIVLTEMEHHSNLIPWQMVAKQTGATLRFIPVIENGTLNLDSLDTIINGQTKLISMASTSNFLGTINPLDLIHKRAKEVGALLMIDGAQSIPHMATNVIDMDCDFLAFSGHKMLAPTGIGILYVKPTVLEKLDPFLMGGEMIKEVWLDHATWNDLPNRFEAGTPDIAGAIGLGAAIDYLEALGMDNVRKHEIAITTYALEKIKEIEELTVLGPKGIQNRGGLISFTLANIHPHDIGTLLDSEGIAIRTGHHCVMPMHRKLNLPASARASFYVYNTYQDIDIFILGLKKVVDYFNNVDRKRG